MTFTLQHVGPHLFRHRAHIEWVEPMLKKRATDLGWDGRSPLRFQDSDGYALGGFVPQEARP